MKAKNLRVPKLGRILLAHEKAGEGTGFIGGTGFDTNLTIRVFRKGQPVKAKDVYPFWHRFWNNIPGNKYEIDLGSGLVTNVGATAIANEAITLASPSGARINTLFLANWHATGTSATAAAATQYKILTISTNGGQTPVAGTQTVDTTSTMAVPKYKTVATVAYTGAEAVTEWGLFTSNTLSSTTGSNASNAYTATTFTAGAGGLTASSSTVQGLQQQIIEPATTTVIGLIQSNTTTVGTLFNNGTTGWFTQAAQTAGSTPGAAELYTLRPVMWDRKQFAAVNVANGDSIQFTYSLQINSGG
jgi:hypothetical protein